MVLKAIKRFNESIKLVSFRKLSFVEVILSGISICNKEADKLTLVDTSNNFKLFQTLSMEC